MVLHFWKCYHVVLAGYISRGKGILGVQNMEREELSMRLKKTAAIVMSAAMVLGLAACGSGSGGSGDGGNGRSEERRVGKECM